MNQLDLLVCDGCGAEITLEAVRVGERRYCCADCAQGRGCECGERFDLDEERRTAAAPVALE